MLAFTSDYIEGAHEKIFEKLLEINRTPMSGYGSDDYCKSACEKIRIACGCPEADIHFLVGGTQTNSTVISGMLNSYEGVVAAETGHISVHEAGAIEYTGHKVLTLPQHEGKINPDELEIYLKKFFDDENHEHMVFPGMVYISYPTEYGTLYSKQELTDLSRICKAYQIPLFIDGARLGYGLASRQCDMTLKDIAVLCDVFYIGGTKVGALFGEAVVFPKGNAPKHFMTTVKQHGALLAKGWLLGVQFDVLFTDELYMNISRHAIEMAEKLKKGFRDKGCKFYLDSPTNQQFFIMENKEIERLKKEVRFEFWERYDEDHTVMRFVTSWSTKEEEVEKLIELL